MVLPKDIDSYSTRRFYKEKLAGSYTSAAKLSGTIRKEGQYQISLNRIKKWAESQDILTLHRAAKHRPQRYRRVIVKGCLWLWDVDINLLSQERFVKANSEFRYILLAIDVFTRFCHASAVRTKQPKDVAEGSKKSSVQQKDYPLTSELTMLQNSRIKSYIM